MLIWKNQLTAFLITFYRPQIEDQCKDQQGSQLRQQFGKSAATEIDGTHYLYKIAQRIDARNPLRPLRHTVDRGEKTTHQNKDKHEEPHDKHGLLQRGRMIGYDQPEPRHHR